MEEVLRDLGLSKYEAKVYIALLSLGESSTGSILKKARIQTGKIYQILDSLETKGFVSILEKDKVKRFIPSDPEKVLNILEERRKKVINEEEAYKNILPELLNKINEKKQQVHIEVFTGFEGLKNAFLKEEKRYKKDELLYVNGILDYKKHQKKIIDYFVYNIFKKREKSKIKIRKIVEPDAKNQVRESNAETRYILHSSFVTYNMISDLVIISIWLQEPIFITVESKEVTKSFIENFDLLWKLAKK